MLLRWVHFGAKKTQCQWWQNCNQLRTVCGWNTTAKVNSNCIWRIDFCFRKLAISVPASIFVRILQHPCSRSKSSVKSKVNNYLLPPILSMGGKTEQLRFILLHFFLLHSWKQLHRCSNRLSLPPPCTAVPCNQFGLLLDYFFSVASTICLWGVRIPRWNIDPRPQNWIERLWHCHNGTLTHLFFCGQNEEENRLCCIFVLWNWRHGRVGRWIKAIEKDLYPN